MDDSCHKEVQAGMGQMFTTIIPEEVLGMDFEPGPVIEAPGGPIFRMCPRAIIRDATMAQTTWLEVVSSLYPYRATSDPMRRPAKLVKAWMVLETEMAKRDKWLLDNRRKEED